MLLSLFCSKKVICFRRVGKPKMARTSNKTVAPTRPV